MPEEHYANQLIQLCQTFNQFKVRYLVVGGSAVQAYGYDRPSSLADGEFLPVPDFDLWFQPTYLNYMRMLDALSGVGLDMRKHKEEKHPFPKSSFFRFKRTEYHLDLLPRLSEGMPFNDCYERRETVRIDGVDVPIISLKDLVIAKKASGRKKDFEDIEALKKIYGDKLTN